MTVEMCMKNRPKVELQDSSNVDLNGTYEDSAGHLAGLCGGCSASSRNE